MDEKTSAEAITADEACNATDVASMHMQLPFAPARDEQACLLVHLAKLGVTSR